MQRFSMVLGYAIGKETAYTLCPGPLQSGFRITSVHAARCTLHEKAASRWDIPASPVGVSEPLPALSRRRTLPALVNGRAMSQG